MRADKSSCLSLAGEISPVQDPACDFEPSLATQSPPKLRPFFSYYGGKWRDTPRNYPPPKYDTIIEPFAGSAGYALRYPNKKVVLCELDPIVYGVWDYLTSVSEKEIRAIPDVPLDGSVDDLKVCQEAKWLVGFWLNRGTTSPRRTPSKWMRDRVRIGSFWGERVRETIASQLKYIDHWDVYPVSYDKCPVWRKSTWFIDPPYYSAGQHYRFGSDQIDYHHLSEWCQKRRGQVIVCENKGATWLTGFTPVGDVKTTRRGHRSNEVVWIKG